MTAVLDAPHTGLLVFDGQLRTVHVTSQVRQLLGIPPELSIDQLDVPRILRMGTLDSLSAASAEIRVVQAGLNTPAEPLLLRTRGEYREIRMTVRSIGSDYRVASFEDTGQERDGGIRRKSKFDVSDSLTRLASRRSFENAVDEALARKPAEPFAEKLLDLDRFKAVNETLGHPAGDAVLRLAAERILSSVRKSDIAARLGGDEFAVLIYPAPTQAEPILIAKRILELVQRTYLVEGHLVNVGTSLGIALAPAHGNRCEGLIRNADLALYHAKSSGRATFHFFDSKMEARAQARRTSELELRRALALRQLEVHYQPQVDIKPARLIGFEALVRWRHPERGLIPPGDFLPLAEEIGVIVLWATGYCERPAGRRWHGRRRGDRGQRVSAAIRDGAFCGYS